MSAWLDGAQTVAVIAALVFSRSDRISDSKNRRLDDLRQSVLNLVATTARVQGHEGQDAAILAAQIQLRGNLTRASEDRTWPECERLADAALDKIPGQGELALNEINSAAASKSRRICFRY